MSDFILKKRGRRAFKPTDLDRQRIEQMHAMGISQEQIAAVYDITPKTLRKHLRAELSRAAVEANFNVSRTLYDMATSGHNVAATIFWLKTRMRLKSEDNPDTEIPTPVVVNNDGGPIYRD